LALSPLNVNTPAIDIKTGNPLQSLQLLSEGASKLPPLTGTGSPEGIIESKQGRFYINIAGGVGTTLYVKRLDDIAGDRKTGWTLV